MSTSHGAHGRTSLGPAGGDDPIVTVLREHTELQVVAERFRQIADALERGEATAWKDATEGVEVHRRFLIGVHQRRESLLWAELRSVADAAVRAGLDRCAIEHPVADRFQADATAIVRAAHSPDSARRLGQLMRAEADRFVEHHRKEMDTLYHPIRARLTPELTARLTAAVKPLLGEAAAAQAEMTAWTSHANPSAD